LSSGLLFALFLLFTLPGLAYGVTIGKIKNSNDFVEGMTEAMKTMGRYIVLSLFAAQLSNYFDYSNMGTILATSVSDCLKSIHLVGLSLLLAFILLSAFIYLFMWSDSAKWTLLSPIFTPIFYELNIAPEATLMAYRIEDSTTNIISPLMSYYAMILVFMKSYDEDYGIGTLIAIMSVDSRIFLVVWILLISMLYLLGWPL